MRLKVPDSPLKQRPENLLLYLLQEGVKKRRQASKVARVIRATLIHPSVASASTVHAREAREVRQPEVGKSHSDTAHYRGVSMYSSVRIG